MKIFKFIRLKRGISLIEAVVSVAILSLISVFIISVIVVSLNTVADNASLKKSDANAAAGIENTLADYNADSNISITTEETGSFTVDFGGVPVTEYGEYITGNDNSSEAEFHYFYPH